MSTDFIVSVLGWIGSICILGAYAMSSYQILPPTSRIYQGLNLFGAILLIINSAYNEVYPFTFINSVWCVVAIIGLLKSVKPTEK
jgi:hypothetical protein